MDKSTKSKGNPQIRVRVDPQIKQGCSEALLLVLKEQGPVGPGQDPYTVSDLVRHWILEGMHMLGICEDLPLEVDLDEILDTLVGQHIFKGAK